VQSELRCFTYKEKREDSKANCDILSESNKQTFSIPFFITIPHIWINMTDQIIILFISNCEFLLKLEYRLDSLSCTNFSLLSPLSIFPILSYLLSVTHTMFVIYVQSFYSTIVDGGGLPLNFSEVSLFFYKMAT